MKQIFKGGSRVEVVAIKIYIANAFRPSMRQRGTISIDVRHCRGPVVVALDIRGEALEHKVLGAILVVWPDRRVGCYDLWSVNAMEAS